MLKSAQLNVMVVPQTISFYYKILGDTDLLK